MSLEKDSVVAIWSRSFERGKLSKGLENFLRMGDAGEDLGLGEEGNVRASKSSSLGNVAQPRGGGQEQGLERSVDVIG